MCVNIYLHVSVCNTCTPAARGVQYRILDSLNLSKGGV